MAKKQAAKATPREPEVLERESPDLKLVATDGGTLLAFLAPPKLVEFFRTAGQLEEKALATLAAAKALKAPKDQDSDSAIQTFIKTATVDRKAVETHWSICSLFSQVHRKLTAARSRATDPLESASALAQKLHNDYADNERRKAAAEQERLRLQAEAVARAEREAEARRLEDEATVREEASAVLSEREQMFVQAYVLPFYTCAGDAVEAARRAGYKNPDQAAPKLLSREKIMAAIAGTREAESIRQQAAATREKPLDVRVETVKPAIGRATGGSFDRATHSAEVLNERLFIEAAVGGQHGIPLDCLTVNEAKLNEYARSLQERINLWPGIRHKKNTKTI